MQQDAGHPIASGYILLGRVEKARGLKGEISFHPLSGQPENFGSYQQVQLVGPSGAISAPLAVSSCRTGKKEVIVRLEKVNSRNEAEQLVGQRIIVHESALPAPATNEYYWHSLIGLPVATAEGEQLGTVQALFHNGAHDIVVVRQGQQELLLPLVASMISAQQADQLILDLPPGLLELYRGDAADTGSYTA